MITYQETTDATYIYRDSSGVSTLKMDRTADTGNLMQVMRDSILVFGPAVSDAPGARMPEQPEGTIEAVSRG